MHLIDYLNNMGEHKIKDGLKRMTAGCARLNDPQNSFKSVHIAGTNGKGSTAVFLEKILRDSGLKVGLYTSPHLVCVRERIQIDRKIISEDEIEKVFQRIYPVIRELELSYFELITLIAFEYFKEQMVDIVVMETGLGGRLDATNVIVPALTLFTKISIDHADILGGTLEQIATEKAGIIKPGVPVISVMQDDAVTNIIKARANEMSSPYYISEIKEGLKLGLAGDHQKENASLAISAAVELKKNGFKINEEFDLSTASWPGRLQRISAEPEIIVDGAHNPDGVRTLVNYLNDEHQDREKIIIFSAMKNKDLDVMIGMLKKITDKFVFYELDTERSLKAADLSKTALGSHVDVATDVRSAISNALAFNLKNPLIVVSGSLYLVGEFLKEYAKTILD